MAPQAIPIPLPILGVNKATPLDQQPKGTSPSAMNCWGIDSSSARQRLGIRPSKISLGGHGASTVYHAQPISYTASSVTTVALALCGSSGTFTSPDAVTWTEHVSTNVGALTWPQQASCAIYQGYLYQASADSATVRRRDFVGGAEEALAISGSGSVPTNCGIVVRHGNRLWLMGDKNNPHVFYASKVGDPRVWDYTNVTESGAFTSTGSTGGLIGEPIVAAISQTENCLLIFSLDTIYAVRGNPRGGRIDKISSVVGALGNTAVCNDDKGNTYVVTKMGLYRIPAGGGFPEPVSRGPLPNDLIGIDPADGDRVAVGYDHRWPGVHVYVDYNSGTDVSFFYDLATGAFWPQSFSAMPRLAVTFPKIQTDNNSSIVVFDNSNAYQFKRDAEGAESAESRDSHVFIPLPLPPVGGEAILQSVAVLLAKDSADVAWKIYAGKTAEQAFNLATASFTGTNWEYDANGYLQTWQFPRVKYGFAYIRIADVSNNRWLLEKIMARLIAAGLLRV